MTVPYYPGSDPITPVLGLSLSDMSAEVAEDFILIDAAFGSIAPSSSVGINGVAVSNPNFNNLLPAAPPGSTNVIWQVNGSNVSGYVTIPPAGTFPITKAAAASRWLNSYDSITGLFTATQPAYSDLSGTPQLAQTEAAVVSNWLSSYDAATGLFTRSQPAFSDISGFISPGQEVFGVNAQVGVTYTVLDSDRFKLITFNSTSAVAVTLPQAGVGGNFVSGWATVVENISTGIVTITPTASTINGMATIVLAPFQHAWIISNGANYFALFTKVASTDAAASLSAYLQTDAGTGAAQNQVVMINRGATPINTKRKGFNVYLEHNMNQATANYDGLQVNAGCTVDANTVAPANQGRFDGIEVVISTSANASGSLTLQQQQTALCLRNYVDVNTSVGGVQGILLFLPTIHGTVGQYIGFDIDTPTGGGTVTEMIGIQATLNTSGVTCTSAVCGQFIASGTVTNGYGLIAGGNKAGLIVDANPADSQSSFIGHGDLSSLTPPYTLYDGWYSVTGTPEAALSANVGSMCSRRDGGAGTSFYVKESGTGNTGWKAVLTSSPTSLLVSQAGNGFTLGEAVYFNGTNWVAAKADAVGTLGIALVSVVGDPNFTVMFAGKLTGMPGGTFTAGAYYFVSDSVAGALTATEPVTAGHFSNPILFALSDTSGEVIESRPAAISAVFVAPVSMAEVAHKWLDSYDSTTGGFTQSQPAFTDISGAASTGQIPNLDASKITTGVLALARGGNTFSALGDLIYGGVAAAPTVLSGNITAVKQYLSQTGSGAVSAAPAWATIAAGDISGLAAIATSGKWSDLQNATAALTLSNGANTTTFNQTSAVAWLWANTTSGALGSTNASPLLELAANYWTAGSASAQDLWTIGTSLAAGVNGDSKLTFTHTGSSGTVAVVFPAGAAGANSIQFSGGLNVGIFGQSNFLSLDCSSANGGGLALYGGSTLLALFKLNYTTVEFGGSAGSQMLTTRAAATLALSGNVSTGAYPSIALVNGDAGGTAFTGTSGTQVGVLIGNGTTQPGMLFSPTSGNAKFVCLNVNPAINQTGTSSGAYTALQVNVVETALLGATNKLLLDLQAGSTGGTSELAVNNTGLVIQYNAIATVGRGVPAQYGTADLTSQTAVKTATTLYTPTATGWYRISAYLKVTTVASTGAATSTLGGVTITFQDGTDSVAQSVVMSMTKPDGSVGTTNTGNTTTTLLAGTLAVYAKTGVAIQYAIGYASDTAAQMAYEARLRCEAL